MIAVLFVALALAGGEPRPDPPPGGVWDGTYVDWVYDTVDVAGFYRMRCLLPADGSPRSCWITGYTRRGVVAAIRGITPTLIRVPL